MTAPEESVQALPTNTPDNVASVMKAADSGTTEAHKDEHAKGEPKAQRPGLPRFTTSKENVLAQFFIGAIDQGTTSTRFIIFDGTGMPVASHQHEFTQHYPQSGWHEHDPKELYASAENCIKRATATFHELGHETSDIRAIGVTNQRETALVWDSETGEALHNAIAWPDTRTKGLVRELKQKEEELGLNLAEMTGMPLSTYPSAVKLVWLLRHVPKVREAYDAGRLAFGTVDTWLLYNLNGKKKEFFVTDSTNASRTMFMNLHTVKYDQKLLDFFDIDSSKVHLPRIVPSSDAEAYGSIASGPLAGMRIAGCLGDQSAALVGQQGFTPGSAKSTYGTGCFLLYNVGEKPVVSTHGLLATIAYDFGRHRKPVYALEGSVAVAGSGVKFLMNNMGFITHSHKISDLAATVDDNGGCVFVTAFSGLFAPYWIDDAKGTIFGITQHTQRGHIARATLEATCFQTRAILDAMEMDSGHKLTSLAVDGGMSNSNLCMQAQANISGISVDRPAMRETTALGAAIAAGFAVDIWKEFDELKAINQKDRVIFNPDCTPEVSKKMYEKWTRAVQMCKGWLDPEEAGGEFD
ncbi:Putative carbohydrate kinase, FGGY, ATPase, nucleotide binding domain-containing protein [Septoria linicola]|uniref:glycerol kinase n=1 Tax=Septoria linicola TaxID=215465 RepID=A0A9Q9ALV3_9PEZI|nr:putative carbohydrate kinase, FGGY, ATPase, nucleotide binding domain-containing protein [Septoria linicola]USW51832.1 Putative carbohydrate kinase, FGGY, ATPase, nucleotide binding domain-containing protein [Septoria linicola]